MRIAICSLSRFTHVAEFIDAAEELAKRHDVRYLLGYPDADAMDLLRSRGIPHELILDEMPPMKSPAAAGSTHQIFTDYFFRQAQAILPKLVDRLEALNPGLILAHLRDYAGLNAAELLSIPVVSFGSHASPVRSEPLDPPFGSGLSRKGSAAQRALFWKLHHEFNRTLDREYNRMLRAPHGLPPVSGASTHASGRLILLSIIPTLGHAISAPAAHVRYVGPLFSRTRNDPRERALLERIRELPRPRVFLSLGTTYGSGLMENCLQALTGFHGSLIASGCGESSLGIRAVRAPFFHDVDAIIQASDAVVTVCGGKTVMDSLKHGAPMVGLPRQGEQRDIALALADQGTAILPCLRKWDGAAFRSAIDAICGDPSYRSAANILRREVESSGQAGQVVIELEKLMSALQLAA